MLVECRRLDRGASPPAAQTARNGHPTGLGRILPVGTNATRSLAFRLAAPTAHTRRISSSGCRAARKFSALLDTAGTVVAISTNSKRLAQISGRSGARSTSALASSARPARMAAASKDSHTPATRTMRVGATMVTAGGAKQIWKCGTRWGKSRYGPGGRQGIHDNKTPMTTLHRFSVVRTHVPTQLTLLRRWPDSFLLLYKRVPHRFF